MARPAGLLGLLLLGGAAAQAPLTEWTLITLTDSVKDGAMCIDGSPAAYYIKPGVGKNASNYVLFFEGGGWCTSVEGCYERSKTPLGSSTKYAATTGRWSYRDLLLPDCAQNVNFCDWSSAYLPYCDGGSRAGRADPVVYNKTHTLHFRGFDVMAASIKALLSDNPGAGAPSLAQADYLLITGGSAGGLTTYLHADYIAGQVHAVNPKTVVKAVPEVGFFLDAESIWGGKHLTTQAYRQLADIMNVTNGADFQVNADCMAAHPVADRWRCFMAQYVYPFISTPVFMLNSMVDEWQTSNILAPNPDVSVGVTPYPPFQPCVRNPVAGCNATQAAQWTGYATQFFSALNASQAATPAVQLAQNGGFITSCPIHPTAINGIVFNITIGGVTMYDALSEWFFDAAGGSSGGQHWHYDVPYPGNPTCPKPGLI